MKRRCLGDSRCSRLYPFISHGFRGNDAPPMRCTGISTPSHMTDFCERNFSCKNMNHWIYSLIINSSNQFSTFREFTVTPPSSSQQPHNYNKVAVFSITARSDSSQISSFTLCVSLSAVLCVRKFKATHSLPLFPLQEPNKMHS